VQRLETSESPHYHDGRQEIGKYPKNFVEQRASESSVTETVTEKNFNPILIGESRIQIPFCVPPGRKHFGYQGHGVMSLLSETFLMCSHTYHIISPK